MEGWQKLLLAAGGAAGLAAVVYYLLKEDPSGSPQLLESTDQKKSGVAVEDISKEQVRKILQEIISSQDQVKGNLKGLTQELIKEKLTFEETYKKVKEVEPEDPLEKHGLTMMDFDQLLERHQSDPTIREAITKIMGAPNPNTCEMEKVKSITVDKLIDVHNFMLTQLEKFNSDFQALPNKASYDMKTVTITAQAIVGSKIEQKFGITSDVIESAVLLHHGELAQHQRFAQINMSIQSTMAKLMGGPGGPGR